MANILIYSKLVYTILEYNFNEHKYIIRDKVVPLAFHPPSIWCAEVAVPQMKESAKVSYIKSPLTPEHNAQNNTNNL